MASVNQLTVKTELEEEFRKILAKDGISDEIEEVLLNEPDNIKGEHMGTACYYAEVKFKDKSIKPLHLFAKRFHANSAHTEMVKEMKVMDKEAAFYTKFLPAAKEHCMKYPGCENLLRFIPKCLHADEEMILMENIVLNEGFIMLPKVEKQDFETAKFVLANLARFHAVSFSMVESMGRTGFVEKWELLTTNSYLMGEKNPFINSLFDNVVGFCIGVLENNPVEGQEETLIQLRKMHGNAFQLAMDSIAFKPEEKIICLNHGDCWNNNMLFKLDSSNGKIMEHIFVDFQVTRLASPNSDIAQFLFTSVKPEVRRAQLIELLQHYFKTFQTICQKFGTDCPIEFEEFYINYTQKLAFGFFYGLFGTACAGAMKEMNINELEGNDDPNALRDLFHTAVETWIQKNPEIAKEAAVETVNTVREYSNIRNFS